MSEPLLVTWRKMLKKVLEPDAETFLKHADGLIELLQTRATDCVGIPEQRGASWKEYGKAHLNKEWADILRKLSEDAPTAKIAAAANIGADAIMCEGHWSIAPALLKEYEEAFPEFEPKG